MVNMVSKFPDIFKTLPLFNGDFDAFELKAQNCDVLFASYPAKTYIPIHRHDTDNYGVITRGELILTIKGITKRYAVGDWYHIAANAEHSAEFDMDTDEIEFWFKPS
jgi:quercetin dioxygenase-like cupin family protein